MKLSIMLIILSSLIMLVSGCSSNTTSTLLSDNSSAETTGYWYLGDNGQRQWRSFTVDKNDTQTKYDQGFYKGISPFGGGSGR